MTKMTMIVERATAIPSSIILLSYSRKMIFALHLILFLFCILVPFFGSDELLLINTAFLIGVLFHWMMNNNACFLTQLENMITGRPNHETFFGRLFGDFYTKTEQCGHVSWIILIALILYSIHKVVKRQVLQKFIQNVRNI